MIMTTAVSQKRSPRKSWFHALTDVSWPWRITGFYLTVMLFVPTVALFLKAGTLPPERIWEIATDPVALSAYNVTFGWDGWG